MTTVGSDLFPTTTASKTLAVALALVGVSFVAVLTGAIAERFLAPDVEREAEEVEEELDATSAALLKELRGMRDQLDRVEVVVRRGMQTACRRRTRRSSGGPNRHLHHNRTEHQRALPKFGVRVREVALATRGGSFTSLVHAASRPASGSMSSSESWGGGACQARMSCKLSR